MGSWAECRGDGVILRPIAHDPEGRRHHRRVPFRRPPVDDRGNTPEERDCCTKPTGQRPLRRASRVTGRSRARAATTRTASNAPRRYRRHSRFRMRGSGPATRAFASGPRIARSEPASSLRSLRARPRQSVCLPATAGTGDRVPEHRRRDTAFGDRVPAMSLGNGREHAPETSDRFVDISGCWRWCRTARFWLRSAALATCLRPWARRSFPLLASLIVVHCKALCASERIKCAAAAGPGDRCPERGRRWRHLPRLVRKRFQKVPVTPEGRARNSGGGMSRAVSHPGVVVVVVGEGPSGPDRPWREPRKDQQWHRANSVPCRASGMESG